MINNETQPNLPVPASNLRVELIPSSELLQPNRKAFLRSLVRLLNDAYSAHGHPRDDGEDSSGWLFLRKRVMQDESWVAELGSDSLVAVCMDQTLHEVLRDTKTSEVVPANTYGSIVATGSLKPWKGKVADIVRSANEAMKLQDSAHSTPVGLSDVELTEAAKQVALENQRGLAGTWNWEISSCASCDDPRYRGRGLMVKCVDALVADLKIRHAELRKSGDPRGQLPIKLWSTSLEGTGNTEYWLRRGFVKVGETDIVPAATWSSRRELTLQTLSKIIE